MNIALAHDSFTQIGGAERVFEGIRELYPESPIYTIATDRQVKPLLNGGNIRNSILQPLYGLYPHLQRLFPLIPFVLAYEPAIKADILLSSSSSYAKGLKVTPTTLHINYCHTPTRFLWVDTVHADQEVPAVLRPLAHLYFKWLRGWDLRKAQRIDHFIANSREVQKRIKQYYGKDSLVIPPFIDIHFWEPTRTKENYFLIAGRLQRSKGLELVIKVFNELKLPLHVVGTGRYEQYLRSIAGPTVTFLGRLNDDGLRHEYSGALGFIYPQLEDFGIMPVEAAACGTATIALAQGGSLETVLPSITGELLPEITEASLSAAIKNWHADKYTIEGLRHHAAGFSKEVFQQRISSFVNQVYENSH